MLRPRPTDVATRTDLDHLATTIRAELAEVRVELHTELTRQSRHFTTVLLASTGFVVSANAAVVALVQLL